MSGKNVDKPKSNELFIDEETGEEYKPLWGRQKKFVELYLDSHCKDPVGSYKKAGYKGTGEYAQQQAYNLLQQDHIQKEIQRRLKEIEKKANISLLDILNRLAKIANFDIRSLYDHDGNLKDIHELNEEQAAAIASMDIQKVSTEFMFDEEAVFLPGEELTRGGEKKPPTKGRKTKTKLPTVTTTTKVKVWDVKEAYELLIKILTGGGTTLKLNVDGSIKHEVEGKVDHNVKGGVILVPGMMTDMTEWSKMSTEIIEHRQKKKVEVEAFLEDQRKKGNG